MKKKKMELQLEHLELINYKLKLEILELEQKLNIAPSKYTKIFEKLPDTPVESGPKYLLLTHDNIIIDENGNQNIVNQ